MNMPEWERVVRRAGLLAAEQWEHEKRNVQDGPGDRLSDRVIDAVLDELAPSRRITPDLRRRLLEWVQAHFIQRYENKTVVSHSEACEELCAVFGVETEISAFNRERGT